MKRTLLPNGNLRLLASDEEIKDLVEPENVQAIPA